MLTKIYEFVNTVSCGLLLRACLYGGELLVQEGQTTAPFIWIELLCICCMIAA
jgi:hypothetical protein